MFFTLIEAAVGASRQQAALPSPARSESPRRWWAPLRIRSGQIRGHL